MKIFTFLFAFFFISNLTYAFDATNLASIKNTYDDWSVIEFPMPKGLIYRISTTSLVSKKEHLTFDFLPNGACQAEPAVMVQELKGYEKALDGGMLPFEFKIPNQASTVDIVKTQMQKGDKFVFFAFTKLDAQKLLNSSLGGRVAMWIPPSGDGTVKRSENIYFSLNGVGAAYNQARRLCLANK